MQQTNGQLYYKIALIDVNDLMWTTESLIQYTHVFLTLFILTWLTYEDI